MDKTSRPKGVVIGFLLKMWRISLENQVFMGMVSFRMNVSDFIPILIQVAFVAGLAGAIITGSHLFGQRGGQSKIKNSPYECGVKSDGKTSTRFSVKFYVTAMLFILFDIEVIFLIPWVVVYREFIYEGLPIMGPILFFLAVLVIGLLYEIKKGALRWER